MSDTEKVYSLGDLRVWEVANPAFAVVGKPIAHSLSPQMHNAALAMLRNRVPAFAGRKYFRFEIAPAELPAALPLFFEKNFFGLNLTIPHKVTALSLLKKNSPAGTLIGAANTLSRDDASGGWAGENTDGTGFARAVEMRLGRKLAGTPVILLGAGGAARSIAVTALANNCRSLTLVNRSRDKAEALADALRRHFPGAEICCGASDGVPPENALVVNATSLGLSPDDASPFAPALLRPDMAVYDTTYGSHRSALVSAARERLVPADDGRAMLAWQGALAFEIWNGIPAGEVFPLMFSAISGK